MFRSKFYFIVGIAAGAALLSACSKPVAKVPSGWTSFQPADAAFSCDAPVNWQISQFSDMGTDSGGNFVSGPAKINITASMAGSILGDLAVSNNNQAQNLADQLGTQAPATKSPAQQSHEQFAAAMVHEFPDYTESSEQPVQGKAGAGWISEFTDDSGKTHGYRATFLGKDRSFEIVCTCPPEDWSELQSSFEHVIQSIAPGTAGS